MKLFKLERRYDLAENEDPWNNVYDVTDSVLVRALNKESARKLAADEAGDEADYNKPPMNPWLSEKYTTCKEVSLNWHDKEEVICCETFNG